LPLFIHPHYTVGADWMGGYGHALLLGLGFTFETTTAAARLILGGVLERHPGLVLVLAHGGGALPYLAGRLEACAAADPTAARNLRRPFGDYARRLYYDALLYQAPSVSGAAQLAGADHLLFGSDHPFGIADPAACLAAIRGAVTAPEARAQMLGGNAQRLLGLPAGPAFE
jgi:predicted TIM-barrel fold metal-dependent hydrolase